MDTHNAVKGEGGAKDLGTIRPGMRFTIGKSLVETLAGTNATIVKWRLVNGPLIDGEQEGDMPLEDFKNRTAVAEKAA